MIKRALVVGGANGIGLSIATELARRNNTEYVYIVDKVHLKDQLNNSKFESHLFDLTNNDYSLFNRFTDIDCLMITAGIGKLSLFKDIPESHITNSFNVNTISAIRLIHKFYDKLESKENFYCGVMVSIAGFMSSPFYAVYGATKAALKIFIESVNVELKKSNSLNRILNVSPGSIDGTSFLGGETDLSVTAPIAHAIIEHLEAKDDLFIPQYEEVFKDVLQRYQHDFRSEGEHSYDYKLNRMKEQNERIDIK